MALDNPILNSTLNQINLDDIIRSSGTLPILAGSY